MCVEGELSVYGSKPELDSGPMNMLSLWLVVQARHTQVDTHSIIDNNQESSNL